jgi:hypothetical protein
MGDGREEWSAGWLYRAERERAPACRSPFFLAAFDRWECGDRCPFLVRMPNQSRRTKPYETLDDNADAYRALRQRPPELLPCKFSSRRPSYYFL